MALDFPGTPSDGQTYTSGTTTWTYSSASGAWKITSSGPTGFTGSQGVGFTGSQGVLGYTGSAGSGSGGSFTLTTVEVNIGSNPRRSGAFGITGTGLTPGKPVFIQQAVGPYTGKGTLEDEAEMDQVNVTALVEDATNIIAYWTSTYDVRGNLKFNYIIGA